jgi:hypothetical protein
LFRQRGVRQLQQFIIFPHPGSNFNVDKALDAQAYW